MWLVGMMGSGKTSLGQAASHEVGTDFYDSDEIIETRSGRSISETWEESGEEEFRRLESAVLQELSALPGIKSTGGGSILSEANRMVLANTPPVIWLRARPQALAERLEGSGDRPLLAGEESIVVLQRLLEERSEHYKAVATHEIDTDVLGAAEATTRLVEIWTEQT